MVPGEAYFSGKWRQHTAFCLLCLFFKDKKVCESRYFLCEQYYMKIFGCFVHGEVFALFRLFAKSMTAVTIIESELVTFIYSLKGYMFTLANTDLIFAGRGTLCL